MAGLISFFNLDSWYKETFSEEERNFMEMKREDLYQGKAYFGASAAYFLAELSMCYNTKANYVICKKIIDKAIALLDEHNESAENKHFYFMHLIRFFYKNRDIDNNMEKAVFFCQKQIDISKQAAFEIMNNPLLNATPLGTHTGFTQLAIIYKKQKDWKKVIELCKQAKADNWGGDWDKRIEEAQKQLN